jgi:hypothetical protein
MSGTHDGGVPFGALLSRFAEAVATGDFAAERAEVLEQMGPEALVDAAGVIAVFNAVVKVADGIGIPLEDFKADTSAGFRADLGIDGFART